MAIHGPSKVIRLKGASAKAVVAPSSWSHAKRSASGRKSGRHRGGTARGCQSLRRGEHLQFCRGPGGAGYRYRYSTLVQYRYPILVYCNGKKYTVPLNGKVLYTVQKHRESRGQKTQLSSRASVFVLPVFGW